MPLPVSLIATATSLAFFCTVTAIFPLVLNYDALSRRFVNTWVRRDLSAVIRAPDGA